jgi:hypothetical protein
LPSLSAWRRVGHWLSPFPPSGMSRLGPIDTRFSRRREVLVEARRIIFLSPFIIYTHTHILCLSIRIGTFSRVEFQRNQKKPLGVFLTWIENFQFRCVFSRQTNKLNKKKWIVNVVWVVPSEENWRKRQPL